MLLQYFFLDSWRNFQSFHSGNQILRIFGNWESDSSPRLQASFHVFFHVKLNVIVLVVNFLFFLRHFERIYLWVTRTWEFCCLFGGASATRERKIRNSQIISKRARRIKRVNLFEQKQWSERVSYQIHSKKPDYSSMSSIKSRISRRLSLKVKT